MIAKSFNYSENHAKNMFHVFCNVEESLLELLVRDYPLIFEQCIYLIFVILLSFFNYEDFSDSYLGQNESLLSALTPFLLALY